MTRLKNNSTTIAPVISIAALLAAIPLAGCTGQIHNSFRFSQQDESFGTSQTVNTKIDLLWVVDNSASMDVNQDKLRRGFAAFATKYMKPTWDIRVAVIPTDLFLANPAFQGYLGRTIGGSQNWLSSYVSSRVTAHTWVNPAYAPSLVDLTTGRFSAAGFTYAQMVPSWGAIGFPAGTTYAHLLPGLHDGPVTALCTDQTPTGYFLKGNAKCSIRDNQLANTGISHCLNPATASGETSITQCVNTVENDSVHSGRAIIQTMPPEGTAGDAAWTQQLINDFLVNASTGVAGNGSERGMGSVLELLDQNEVSDSKFFRPGSLRGIIFLSDEEDQTLTYPASAPAGFMPTTGYVCDMQGLLALNPTQPARVNGPNGYCCPIDSANHCTFYDPTQTVAHPDPTRHGCPSKTIDGYTYTVSLCPPPDQVMPVAAIKDRLDSFFNALDAGDPNPGSYFVISIVPLTGDAVRTMQGERNPEDALVGALHTVSTDRGDRYIQLGTLVGNGSLAMNMADSDYSPILDAIGQQIVNKKSSFTLQRAPTGSEDMIVKILHQDGSFDIVPADKYTIDGKTLTIIDSSVVLSLSSTDHISINYQPKTAF